MPKKAQRRAALCLSDTKFNHQVHVLETDTLSLSHMFDRFSLYVTRLPISDGRFTVAPCPFCIFHKTRGPAFRRRVPRREIQDRLAEPIGVGFTRLAQELID